jgi:hypothetical protein
MAEKPRPESIISIVNAKSADIEQTDQTIIHVLYISAKIIQGFLL